MLPCGYSNGSIFQCTIHTEFYKPHWIHRTTVVQRNLLFAFTAARFLSPEFSNSDAPAIVARNFIIPRPVEVDRNI